MIDRTRCMASINDPLFDVVRCQEPATHNTVLGRRCARHAEAMRQSLRNPNTVGNLLVGGRARTEEEIALLIVELPS